MKAKLKEKEEKSNVCQAIGTTVVGLYYLSSQARKDKIEGLAPIIDAAIVRAMELGCTLHEDKLKGDFESEIYAMINEACAFIDRYCAISDPDAKKHLASIIKNANLTSPSKLN